MFLYGRYIFHWFVQWAVMIEEQIDLLHGRAHPSAAWLICMHAWASSHGVNADRGVRSSSRRSRRAAWFAYVGRRICCTNRSGTLRYITLVIPSPVIKSPSLHQDPGVACGARPVDLGKQRIKPWTVTCVRLRRYTPLRMLYCTRFRTVLEILS
jgi:hypothetical protein